jgi:hypothetical protein
MKLGVIKKKKKEILFVRAVWLECASANVEYSGAGSVNLAKSLGPSKFNIVI